MREEEFDQIAIVIKGVGLSPVLDYAGSVSVGQGVGLVVKRFQRSLTNVWSRRESLSVHL